MPRFLISGLLVLMLGAFAATARADAAGARKAIADAKSKLADHSWNEVDDNLRIAEAELDGVTGADKDAITKEIAAVRKQMADVRGGEGRERVIKELDMQIDMAKKSMGDRGGYEITEKTINELLSSDAGKALPADVVAKYKQQFATLKKASESKAQDRTAERVTMDLDNLDKDLPDALKVDPNSPEGSRQALESVARKLEMIGKELPGLPSNGTGEALKARYAKMQQQINSASAGRDSAEVAGTLQRSWDSYKNEFDGWESENDAGPTFDEARKEQSESMRALRAPKTVALLSRANAWLESNTNNESYNAVKDTPAVKQIVESVKKMHATALAKMEPRAEKLVASAEALKDGKPDNANSMQYMASDWLRLDIPGSSKLEALQARLNKKAASITGAAAAGTEALAKAAADMTKAANDNWPKISSGLSAKDVSDPSKLSEGDLVRIKKANRLGWDYSPGDYNYAATINGSAIAGKFDANTAAAYKSVSDKTGNAIPDDDWEVIGKVEADGKIAKRESADVRDTSGSTIGRVEGHETVPCKIIRIVAVHAGPLAVGPDGVIDEKGSVAAPLAASAGVGSSSGSGWFMKFVMMLIGLAAAAVAFVKARPEAAAQAVGPQGTTTLVTVNKNLAMIGVVVAIVGVIWLLKSLIIGDLLPAAAVTASGLYAASDLLKSKGLMNDAQSAQVKPLGVMIALATAGLAVVHFLVGGWYLF